MSTSPCNSVSVSQQHLSYQWLHANAHLDIDGRPENQQERDDLRDEPDLSALPKLLGVVNFFNELLALTQQTGSGGVTSRSATDASATLEAKKSSSCAVGLCASGAAWAAEGAGLSGVSSCELSAGSTPETCTTSTTSKRDSAGWAVCTT